ncbi:hypothetical protein JCM17845_01660 [Iodidimonas gelatinilytica]|uniref:Porin n=1 Tax=Iodidimonas gelatinilytica TaxID=1236966 RepID=A0A5A7MU25_9PROT|nr:porin [Iodidimonas gelatinilytica]GEQ99542.1 hypothetical protein JCM17845_01660 [Iodidimonas gelatinilytica]
MENQKWRHMRLAGVCGLALMAGAVSAAAQSVEELQAQIDFLRAEIEKLKAERAPTTPLSPAPLAEREAATSTDDPHSVPEEKPLVVKAAGAPSFTGDGFKNFKIRGRIQSDFAQIGDPDKIGTLGADGFMPDRGLGAVAEIRRVRIGAQGEMGDWGYKFEVDFAGGETNVADAYLAYKGIDNLALIVGYQKTQASMEEQVSSLDVVFMERSRFTDAIDLRREMGVTADWSGENWHWKSGIFVDGAFDENDEVNGLIVSSRGHYTFGPKHAFTHMGASVEYRDSGAEQGRLRNRPLFHASDSRLLDTGSLDSTSSLYTGLELAGGYGAFYFETELATLGLSVRDGAGQSSTARFNGASLHLGYFLTGEQRAYKRSAGTWSRTRPDNPLGKGGFGALDVAFGADWVDLDASDESISGGQQLTFLAGLSWRPVDHIRFMANISHMEIYDSASHLHLKNDGTVEDDFGLNMFGLRAQVDW